MNVFYKISKDLHSIIVRILDELPNKSNTRQYVDALKDAKNQHCQKVEEKDQKKPASKTNENKQVPSVPKNAQQKKVAVKPVAKTKK
jgi:hypothetical protein